MSKARGSDVFKHKWILECAIEVTARDPETSKPVSAVCKFCRTFGKEEPHDNEQRKCKRSKNIQLFKKPWRADKMKEHHKKMHSAQWERYQQLSDMEKKAFYKDNTPPTTNSICSSLPRQFQKRTVFCDGIFILSPERDSSN